ncbi:hypothetical protein [Stieleria sp.]|uniref:hypothetical protein n=1 Tax=Stieleria sp. TaxID=2795976 RepID=UPI003569DCCF
MLPVQLKRIATVIAAGRLEEAFDRLMATPQREYREGQRLTDVLIEKLVCRAQQHLAQQRYGDARADCDKAQMLAGRTEQVADLAEQINRMQSEQHSRDVTEQDSSQAAKIQAQLGHFTLGQNLLPTGPSHSRLAAEIERKRHLAVDAATRIERAMDSDDWSTAIAILQSLDADVRRHHLVAEKLNAIIPQIAQRVVGDLESGRLDRAAACLREALQLAPTDARLDELRTSLNRCITALERIGQGKYTDADHQLALVGQVVGPTRWISETRQTLAELSRHAANVRSGPLGLLDGSLPLTTSAPHSPQAPNKVPDTCFGAWVLRVDGLGAVLLLDADRITVGSSSRSQRYDLPLQTEGPSAALFIRRAGDDYFAESEAEFGVNDQPTKRRLLANGDSIGFGRRGRLKFRKPVPASGSAVLQLSGAGLAKREIRCAALMADSLLFSPRGGHFSISGCERPIVVFRAADGYAIKYAGSGGEVHQLEADRSVLLGETRFTLNQIHLS